MIITFNFLNNYGLKIPIIYKEKCKTVCWGIPYSHMEHTNELHFSTAYSIVNMDDDFRAQFLNRFSGGYYEDELYRR